MADQFARGRLVSVLEGGYSDKTLIGGAMAHLCGLVDLEKGEGDWVNEEWWNVENLIKVRSPPAAYLVKITDSVNSSRKLPKPERVLVHLRSLL